MTSPPSNEPDIELEEFIENDMTSPPSSEPDIELGEFIENDMTSPPSNEPDIELEVFIENVGTAHQGFKSAVLEAADRGDVQALTDILRTNKEEALAVSSDTGDKERFHFISFGKKNYNLKLTTSMDQRLSIEIKLNLL